MLCLPTLRGHGFLELLLEDNFGPFVLHSCFWKGRTTVNGVHLLDGKPAYTSFQRSRVWFLSSSLAPA